jgi:hypothetical protein
MRCVKFLMVCVLGSVAGADAATIRPASCSRGDVGSAVNSAQNGDTVVIPAGTCTWTTALVIEKAITLQGAGIDVTNIRSAVGSGPVLLWQNVSTGLPRLTGISFFNGNTATGSGGMVQFSHITNLRVDHNKLQTDSEGSGVTTSFACATGVADHNEFITHAFAFSINTFGCSQYGDGEWAEPANAGGGNFMFYETNSFSFPGGWMFNEAHDGWRGGRSVFRFNTLRNLNWLTHGTDSTGRERGARFTEIYKNSWRYEVPASVAGTYFGTAITFRGGNGIAFDNAVTNVNASFHGSGPFSMTSLRAAVSEIVGEVHPYWPFGVCFSNPATFTRNGSTVTVTTEQPHHLLDTGPPGTHYVRLANSSDPAYNGVHQITGTINWPINNKTFTFSQSSGAASGTTAARGAFDQFDDESGWRCLDQAGAGQGRLFNDRGDGVPSQIEPANQAREPLYFWQNTFNGQRPLAHAEDAARAILENRDYFNENDNFSSDPSRGLGRGPIAQRPACTTNYTAWWATDEGEWDSTHAGPDGRLYRCMNNMWSLYYTPYVYPHPLVSGAAAPPAPPPPSSGSQAPPPPQNLRVIGAAQ